MEESRLKKAVFADVEPSINIGSPSDLTEDPVLPRWRLICLCISTSCGLFLSLLDSTIVSTALYTIGVDLNTLQSINWTALAYTLSYLSCSVLFARLGDIVGRRNAYIAAFSIFLAFSIGCGFARTINQLIACRTLQGVGGSGLYSLTFVILFEICPPKLAQAIGAIAGAVVAMAGVLGPVLGGVFTRYTTWRWIFWVNAPMGIFPLVLFIIAWPKPNQIRHAQLKPFKELDIASTVLIIAASVLFVFSFQEAGTKTNVNPWKTAAFIAPLVAGCLCWAGLVGWEIFVAKFWEAKKLMTMFPLRLMQKRVYMGYALATLLVGFPYFVVLYSLPLRLQVVNGKSALGAGLSLLPILGATAVASTIGGGINSKKDRLFGTLMMGSLFMLIGTATLSTLSYTDKVEAKMYGFEVFVGLGFGLMVSTVSLGAALECELRDTTISQGIIAQARMLGGSIGIATSTAILGATTRSQLIGVITEAQLSTLETSAKTMTEAQLHAVRQVYSDSFSEGMKVCAAISAACALATLMSYRKNVITVGTRREEQLRFDDEMRRNNKSKETSA